MIPATKDLQIYQGDSFDLLCRIRGVSIVSGQQVPGAYVDLTGATPKAQIRTTPDSDIVVDEIICSLGTQSGDTLGAVNLMMTPEQTAALTAGGNGYVYDFQITFPASGPVNTYFGGKISVLPQITREDA